MDGMAIAYLICKGLAVMALAYIAFYALIAQSGRDDR